MSNDSRRKIGKVLLVLGRIALGVIFLVAAYSKLAPVIPGSHWSIASIKLSLAYFAMGVDSYQMLSPGAANAVAHYLPFFELVLGVWLVSGIGLRLSSLISTIAICGFIYAMYSAYRRGLTINCGCFGQGGAPIGPKDMMRDGLLFLPLSLALLVGSLLIARKPKQVSAPETLPEPQPGH